MHKSIAVLIAMLLSSMCVSLYAQPPSIDDFVTSGKYRNIKISPTGRYFSATVREEGKNKVVVINRKTMKVTGVINFSGRSQPGRTFWVNEERVAAHVLKRYGSLASPEDYGNVFAMNADGSRKKLIFGYESKKGIPVHPTIERMTVLDWLEDDPRHILIASTEYNLRSANRVTAYKLNVYTGKRKKVARSPSRFGELLADSNGQVRVSTGILIEGDKNFHVLHYRKDNDSDWELLKKTEQTSNDASLVGFSDDNKKVYLTSSRKHGDDTADTNGLFSFDVESGQWDLVYRHPRVDIEYVEYWKDTPEAVHITPDYSKVVVLDEQSQVGRWYSMLQKSFPYSEIMVTSATRDRKEAILHVRSEKDPGTYYLFNAEKQTLEQIFSTAPKLESKELAVTEAFKLKARDGEELFGYLTLPVGQQQNLPMIVIPHGGPHGPRDTWTYDPKVQLLASRGYAVLKVNFRGSGGYGARFERLGYGEWGGKMIDDMTDATQWAISQGIADKSRVCIYGGSYGGYASLMSVVKEPDLYQCAVGYVGIYDLELMYHEDKLQDYWMGRNYLKKVLGDDEDKRMTFSPARQVNKIKADLFIVHGEADELAPFEQAKVLKAALDKAGKEYEWLTKADEGHGFVKRENRRELYQKMIAFFDKHTKPVKASE
ncbi:alpha/beta hydrolase family protein [Endozoicomonadaceae bacterium StTr2]